jgi:hypothetical protein
VNVGWIARVALLCGVVVWTGCDGLGLGGGSPGSSISPRRLWRAYGDLRDPGKAIDGDHSTAAVSGNPYPNAYIELDLGKACVFNRVVVEHGPDENGFPARMAVYTSLDGQAFILQGEVPGKRRVTNALLMAPVLARYVRLQAVSPGARSWSVAEIYLQ